MSVRPPWPCHRLAEAGATLGLGYDLLMGMDPLALRDRFDVSLFKADANYIYLDLKPRADRDRAAFQHIRLALYGPGPDTAKAAYLPAQVYVLKPNGDTEVWKFANPQVNLRGWRRSTSSTSR
jgi:TIGR03009 family protein